MKNSLALILVLLCLLSGCMVKAVPPAHIYTISPEWVKSKNSLKKEKRNKFIIKLAPIRGTRAFVGTRILYSDVQYSQNYYAYSRWSDAPVRLLQILFQAVLEKNGHFKAVLPPTSAAKADLLLESTLYDFSHHINSDGTSDGVIRLRFYLIDNKRKRLLATKEFASKVRALSCNARGAVVALNKAAANVACDLASWLLDSASLP